MSRHRQWRPTVSDHVHQPDKISVARTLRRAMTPAEHTLWSALRRRRFGVRWRRQHVLRGFILDFYAPALRMAVEVDGEVHTQQPAEDMARDAALAALGLVVVHVSNADVLHDIDAVLQRLQHRIEPPPQ